MVTHACHPSTWKEGWGERIADSQLYIVSSVWGQQYMVCSMLVWAIEWEPFSRLKFCRKSCRNNNVPLKSY